MSSDAYEPIESFDAWKDIEHDANTVAEHVALLEAVKRTANSESLATALKEAMRTAALETGALEDLYQTDRGLTLTVAGMVAGWEAELDRVGENVRSHFEAQLEAFEMVLDFATNRTPITASWIRELHRQLTAAQTTYRARTQVGWQDLSLPHGEYKKFPNSVLQVDNTVHHYAPVDDVVIEVNRLVDELNSSDFASADPQLQAAYVHYAFIAIHPFADGNGRVARALASAYLYRLPGVPFVIFMDQKARYLAALKLADHGDKTAWVRFVEDRLIDTMSAVRLALRSSESGNLNSEFDRLKRLLDEPRNQDSARLQLLAEKLRRALDATIRKEYEEIAPSLSPASWNHVGTGRSDAESFRHWDGRYVLTDTGYLSLERLEMPPPNEFFVQLRPRIGKAVRPQGHQFLVQDVDRQDATPLYIRAEDLDPEISASLQSQLTVWVKAAIGQQVQEFVQEAERRLG